MFAVFKRWYVRRHSGKQSLQSRAFLSIWNSKTYTINHQHPFQGIYIYMQYMFVRLDVSTSSSCIVCSCFHHFWVSFLGDSEIIAVVVGPWWGPNIGRLACGVDGCWECCKQQGLCLGGIGTLQLDDCSGAHLPTGGLNDVVLCKVASFISVSSAQTLPIVGYMQKRCRCSWVF